MLKIHTTLQNEDFNDYGKITVNGKDADIQKARVSAMPYNVPWQGTQRPLDQTEEAGFVSFESDEKAEIVFEPKFKTLHDRSDVVVRPLSKNIKVKNENGKLAFTLTEYGAYTVEIDGFHNALHIFFNPVRDFYAEAKAEREEKDIIRFLPGEHDIGRYYIKDHTTVVIEGGAVLYGSLISVCAKDVRICGYGIIDGSREKRENFLPYPQDYHNSFEDKEYLQKALKENYYPSTCVRLYACENVLVEGITLRDSSTFAMIPAGCNNIVIDNVKTIGMWRYNSDGIDFINCTNAVLKNSFLRNFDDCIVIKGVKGWDYKNNENIIVENCVVWCDWGRAIEYGAETNAREYKNIIVRNVDVIHGSTVNIDIQHHNDAEIHHCVFEDIRVEYTKYQLPDYIYQPGVPYHGRVNTGHPALIGVPILDYGYFCDEKTYKNGCVHDILYRNIKVFADKDVPAITSYFRGLSPEHDVKNIRIENLTVNGERITTLDNIETNEFTSNITVG